MHSDKERITKLEAISEQHEADINKLSIRSHNHASFITTNTNEIGFIKQIMEMQNWLLKTAILGLISLMVTIIISMAGFIVYKLLT